MDNIRNKEVVAFGLKAVAMAIITFRLGGDA